MHPFHTAAEHIGRGDLHLLAVYRLDVDDIVAVLLRICAEQILQQPETCRILQMKTTLQLFVPVRVAFIDPDAAHQPSMREQRQHGIAAAEVDLHDIAVDRLFEHGRLLRHRIGIQADIHDLQVGQLYAARIVVDRLFVCIKQIHVHHEALAVLPQRKLSRSDPVDFIFDASGIHEHQVICGAVSDRLVVSALDMEQANGPRAVIDGDIDLLIHPRHPFGRNSEQHPLDAAAQRCRCVRSRLADRCDDCLFIIYLSFFHAAAGCTLHPQDIQS